MMLFFLMTMHVCATAARSDFIVQRMQNHYMQLGNFEMTLTTTPHDPLQGPGPSETGRILVGPKGLFRLTYQIPEYKDFIYDGKQVFFYEPQASQVTITEGLQGTDLELVIQLLSGKPVDSKRFEIQACTVALCGKSELGEERVLLVRRQAAGKGTFHRAVLGLSVFGALRRVLIDDPAGGRVEYVLGDAKSKPKLSPKVFNFTIPEGVEVQRIKSN